MDDLARQVDAAVSRSFSQQALIVGLATDPDLVARARGCWRRADVG